MRINNFNFCSGPATLPNVVMELVQQEFFDVLGSGLSVLEISHRSELFLTILNNAKNDLKALLHLPDDYHILFLTGGASTQFSMLPMNFANIGDELDYIQSGYWAKKAMNEAEKMGFHLNQVCSIHPDCTALPHEFLFSNHAKYAHITLNETIDGLEFFDLPETPGDLIGDLSSTILSRPFPVEQFDLIYAGCQKNIGPAGMTLVIIKDQFLLKAKSNLPSMLSYQTHAQANSLYNTPPVFCIYFAGKVFSYLRSLGGLEVMAKKNKQKAVLFYDYLDQSNFYFNPVEKTDRSFMNVPFYLQRPDLEKFFVQKAQSNGLYNLSGHRLKGGLRASFYNAMSLEGVKALINFMEEFRVYYD